MTAQSLKAELDQRLPKGASLADVEALLAECRLEHSGLIDNAKLAHMGADPNYFELKSIVRSGARPALVTTDTSITFVFDRDQRLVDTRVEGVHTGL